MSGENSDAPRRRKVGPGAVRPAHDGDTAGAKRRFARLFVVAALAYNLPVVRRISVIVLAVLAVAVAAWSAFWQHAAGDIEQRLAAWADKQRAAGMTVEHGPVEVSGYPFTWRVEVADPRLAGAGATQWAWRGERVVLDLRPWAIHTVPAAFPGVHMLAAGTGDMARSFALSAARPEGRFELDGTGKLALLVLDLESVVVREPPSQSITRVGRAEVRIRPFRGVSEADYRTDTLGSALRLVDVALPERPSNGLGQMIAHAELDTSFKGQLAPGPLADSVARWRDQGGVVEINRLALAWGPLDVDGDGTVTLDALNRPLGAFTMRVRGYNETVDAVAAAGLIRPREAAGLKVALNLFARPGQNGGPAQLTVPLSAQDGRLLVAGFNLTRLDPIDFR